ncbi:TIR protein [Thioalkalivibrio nitratireducens DSM 14787]|uniref:TIR protein n=1 Tax=Thioalkalivibrio nitratireducens (strain DSM 14787 / UNIQEM 213 / ALEN2) TaxID=1255043 RepID=L0DYH9_THIND|nr:TIR protein [Thioalkalivibrio nitratireducens DSM 14787]
MSYVGPPFSHDIFVSYSHGDDGNGQSYLQPWSVAFAAELERELKVDRRYREPLRIFLDQQHRPGHGVDPLAPLTDQLRREIEASALLLVLMSPDYLASPWCEDEREWWCKRQTATGLPIEGRVVIVQILPTEETWPDVFSDQRGHRLKGFRFHTSGKIPARPLGWSVLPGPRPFGQDFDEALLDIVGRLHLKLDDMQRVLEEQLKARAGAERLAHTDGQVLYLHGRVDQARRWEDTAIALTQEGFAIVPGEPDTVEKDPVKRQEARERRVEIMAESDAVLLLGTDDARAVDTDLIVIGKHDRQSARARSSRPLPCGLLNTVGDGIVTPVRRATARNVQADWLDATDDPWTPAVRQWLAGHSAQLRHDE